MMSLLVSSASCASSSKLSPLPLQLRVLRVCADGSGLCVTYKTCLKEWAGVCWKTGPKEDKYSFSDPAVVKTLIDADFICRQREKP